MVTYQGHRFVVESKSLHTHSIRKEGDVWLGKAQCDASDRRSVTFADGSTLETTCLLAGEFDILAVNLFAFQDEWRFVFAKNSELPRSTYKKIHAAATVGASRVAGFRQLASATAILRRTLLSDGRDTQDFIFRRSFPAGHFTKTMKYEWFFRAWTCFFRRLTPGWFSRTTTNKSFV